MNFENMILIYITNPNQKIAEKIALHLLKKKLIACANISPIRSFCFWKGKLEKSREVVLLVKTRDKYWLKIKKEVEKIHPYEIPCILKFKIDANEAFSSWVNKEVA